MRLKFFTATLALVACIAGRAAADGESQIFMAWNAPYGMPGASDTLWTACDDTTHADTLYLSFEAGHDSPTFYGVVAILHIRPLRGDTLGPYWQIAEGSENRAGVRVELDLDDSFPQPQPWKVNGFGFRRVTPLTGGLVFNFVYAVRSVDVAPVTGGTRYCIARFIFKHRSTDPPGCEAPVCIEWEKAQLGYGGTETINIDSGGSRFVTWNSRGGAACGRLRNAARPSRWSPPPPKMKSGLGSPAPSDSGPGRRDGQP